MSFIFFWVFLVQTHFPSIVSPVFLFFGSTSVAPTNPKELRLTRRCSPQNCETRSAQPIDVWDAVPKLVKLPWAPPSLGSLGFRNFCNFFTVDMKANFGGVIRDPCRRLQPLRTTSKWVNLNPAKRDDWVTFTNLGASCPKVTRAFGKVSNCKKRGTCAVCDCLKALKE